MSRDETEAIRLTRGEVKWEEGGKWSGDPGTAEKSTGPAQLTSLRSIPRRKRDEGLKSIGRINQAGR